MIRNTGKIRRTKIARLLIFLFLCRFLCTGSTALAANAEAEETVSLPLQANSAVLVEARTGRILYGKNESDFMPVASTTKIMTCLLALEQGTKEQICKVTSHAASQPQVRLGVQAGQRFYLRDLLYAMMLESDNDVAVVVAEGIAGSEEAFAKRMNEKAKELGMTKTYFVTPNGLDRDGNGSCALDLARLAQYALQNDAFLKIIATRDYVFSDVDGKVTYTVTNHDAFLTQRKGALGIKTGFTGAAGYCFVGASWEEDRELIAVVLACGWPPQKTKKWEDMRTLFEYGKEQFAWQTVVSGTEHLAEIPVQNGRAAVVSVGYQGEVCLLLQESDRIRVETLYPESLEAPVQAGERIGSVQVWMNDALQAEIPITAEQSVRRTVLVDCIQELLELFLLGNTNTKFAIL